MLACTSQGDRYCSGWRWGRLKYFIRARIDAGEPGGARRMKSHSREVRVAEAHCGLCAQPFVRAGLIVSCFRAAKAQPATRGSLGERRCCTSRDRPLEAPGQVASCLADGRRAKPPTASLAARADETEPMKHRGGQPRTTGSQRASLVYPSSTGTLLGFTSASTVHLCSFR